MRSTCTASARQRPSARATAGRKQTHQRPRGRTAPARTLMIGATQCVSPVCLPSSVLWHFPGLSSMRRLDRAGCIQHRQTANGYRLHLQSRARAARAKQTRHFLRRRIGIVEVAQEFLRAARTADSPTDTDPALQPADLQRHFWIPPLRSSGWHSGCLSPWVTPSQSGTSTWHNYTARSGHSAVRPSQPQSQ